MRKTTLVIDDVVLEDVRKILGTRGIKDTIDAALHQVLRRAAIDRDRRFLVEVGEDILDPETIEARSRWPSPLDT